MGRAAAITVVAFERVEGIVTLERVAAYSSDRSAVMPLGQLSRVLALSILPTLCRPFLHNSLADGKLRGVERQ